MSRVFLSSIRDHYSIPRVAQLAGWWTGYASSPLHPPQTGHNQDLGQTIGENGSDRDQGTIVRFSPTLMLKADGQSTTLIIEVAFG